MFKTFRKSNWTSILRAITKLTKRCRFWLYKINPSHLPLPRPVLTSEHFWFCQFIRKLWINTYVCSIYLRANFPKLGRSFQWSHLSVVLHSLFDQTGANLKLLHFLSDFVVAQNPWYLKLSSISFQQEAKGTSYALSWSIFMSSCRIFVVILCFARQFCLQ